VIDIQALLIEKLTDVVNDQQRNISRLEQDLNDKYDSQSAELGRWRRVVSDLDQECRKLRMERDALVIALKAAVAGAPPAPEPQAAPPEPTRDPTRDPPPPDMLVGALQDVVHHDTGRIRPAQSVKVPSAEDDA
jgi:ABC-type transporter Mla subunit MlaD